MLALISAGAFLLREVLPAGLHDPWGYYLMFQVPLVFLSSFYLVVALTRADLEPGARVLGLSLRAYLALALVCIASVQVMIHRTPFLLVENSPYPGTGPRAFAGPLLPLLLPLLVYLLAGPLALIIGALRRADPGPRRTLIVWSSVGVALIYIAAPLLVGVSLWLAVDGRPLIFVGYTAASVIFYIALARYQVARVVALNRELEQRVEARTLSLCEAQARLVHSEKVAAVGRLAAGMSHELNSPVGALVSTADTLRKQTSKIERGATERGLLAGEAGAALRRGLDNLRSGHDLVHAAAVRVSDALGRLRAFVRLDQAQRQPADLHQCLEEALGQVLQGSDRQVDVVRQFDELPRILCHPAQINQALYHVLENAVQALGEGGEIRLSSEAGGDQVSLTIEDTGHGIRPEDLHRVFEPGFTTRIRGVGAGLGLTISQQIIEAHGGRIRVEADWGQPRTGTAVTITLPLDAPVAA